MELVLSENEKKELLLAARRAIASRWSEGEGKPPSAGGIVDARCGAFVTLKIRGNLRGCIGRLVSDDPLLSTVVTMARSAAFEDPRFPPLAKDELEHVRVEISVLSPLEESTSEQVRVGRHGIYVRRGARAGVLLPQVPVENGWDRELFLSYGCRKAGLAPDAWKEPDTEIYTFTAEVFGE